jgi:hypothetical protein
VTTVPQRGADGTREVERMSGHDHDPERESSRDADRASGRALSHRGAAKAPMTLAEAQRIVQQAERGALDLSKPGTAEVVAEAQRVRFKAELWGADSADDRRRHTKGAVVLVCAFVTLTIAGLVAALVTAV